MLEQRLSMFNSIICFSTDVDAATVFYLSYVVVCSPDVGAEAGSRAGTEPEDQQTAAGEAGSAGTQRLAATHAQRHRAGEARHGALTRTP